MSDEEYKELKDRLETLESIYGDLPDGAYFAVLEENGIDTSDLAAMSDYEEAHPEEIE